VYANYHPVNDTLTPTHQAGEAVGAQHGGSRNWAGYLAVAALGLLVLAGCVGNDLNPNAGWSGVVDGGHVVYVGSMEGQLLALDAETGLFRAAFPSVLDEDEEVFGAIYATPVLRNGLIYLGGFNGKVYNIGADGLLPRTPSFEVNGDELSKGIVGTVAVSGDKIVVGASESAETGRIYVLNAESFNESCRYPASLDDSIGRVWSGPVVDDSMAFVGDLSHRLYAISLDDCSLQWTADLNGGIGSTPLVVDGDLYVGTFDRRFYRVDIDDGTAEVVFQAGGWFWSGIATDGRMLFVPNMDGKLYAVDIASGTVAWEFDTEGAALSAPVIVDDRVVVASDSKVVYVLQANSGARLWEFLVNADVRAPLMAKGSVVYVSSLDHKIYAVDIDARRTFWREPFDTKANR